VRRLPYEPSLITTLGVLALTAGVAIYFLVLQNFFFTVTLTVGAVLIPIGITRLVTTSHDRNIRALIQDMHREPRSAAIRIELIDRLATMPTIKIVQVVTEEVTQHGMPLDLARELRLTPDLVDQRMRITAQPLRLRIEDLVLDLTRLADQ
jgi:hypothetical protein